VLIVVSISPVYRRAPTVGALLASGADPGPATSTNKRSIEHMYE
jgi:hypothetical protein